MAKPYIPDPTIGTVFQEFLGERWVIISMTKRGRHLGIVPLHDPGVEPKVIDQHAWYRGFYIGGWLTV